MDELSILLHTPTVNARRPGSMVMEESGAPRPRMLEVLRSRERESTDELIEACAGRVDHQSLRLLALSLSPSSRQIHHHIKLSSKTF